MEKTNRMFYVLLAALGLMAGLFVASRRAQASDPTEKSGGESKASVVWDDKWTAIGAYVSADGKYVEFLKDTGLSGDTAVAAKIESGHVSLCPKMIVTRWRVHGHMHFL
ncbi:MAG: hypothetical protein WC421_04920 [Elusimicrobiales bacterium]